MYSHIPQLTDAMDDDDALLVASLWWSSSHQARPSVTELIAEIDQVGLSRPRKKNSTLREVLIHVGNRLVEEQFVELKKHAGLCKDDIIIKL